MKWIVPFLAIALSASPLACAAAQKAASNGVVVDVAGDEFKPSIDFTAPWQKTAEGGYVFAVRKGKDGTVTYLVQGIVSYTDGWRFYDRAYLPGGRTVDFVSLGRDVGTCYRYTGCSHKEQYQLTFTPAQVAEALSGSGSGLRVQVGSKGGREFVISVVADHIRAATEVAGVKVPV